MSRDQAGAVLRDVETLYAAGAVGPVGDRELLDRFAHGSEAAFRVLVSRHGPLVWGVCRRALDDPNDAEDAFQATFLVLVRKAGTVRVDGSLGRWLHGVAVKVAARARQKAARRRSRESAPPDDLPAPAGPDPDRDELRGVLDEELAKLPAAFRAAVVLCDLQGASHEEASTRLGCPAGTVKSRLSRGRARLKARLVRRGYGPAPLVLAPSVPPSLERATAALALTPLRPPAAAVLTPAVLSLTQGVLRTMTLSKLKFGAAAMLAAATLALPSVRRAETSALADDRPRPIDIPTVRPPTLTDILPPAAEDRGGAQKFPKGDRGQPWETVVRIKAQHPRDSAVSFASGVVVESRPGRSYVLTVAHNLRIFQGKPDGPVTVDRFNGKLVNNRTVQPTGESFEAALVDLDTTNDLALLSIEPGLAWPVAPLAPPGWKAEAGMPLVSLGCSEGMDATAWSTHVLDTGMRFTKKPGFDGLVCETVPLPGRSGGGLFTLEGDLVGVSLFGVPAHDGGAYAGLESIRRFLETSRPHEYDPLAQAAYHEPDDRPNVAPAAAPEKADTPAVARQASPRRSEPPRAAAADGEGEDPTEAMVMAEIYGVRLQQINTELEAWHNVLKDSKYGIPKDLSPESAEATKASSKLADEARLRIKQLMEEAEAPARAVARAMALQERQRKDEVAGKGPVVAAPPPAPSPRSRPEPATQKTPVREQTAADSEVERIKADILGKVESDKELATERAIAELAVEAEVKAGVAQNALSAFKAQIDAEFASLAKDATAASDSSLEKLLGLTRAYAIQKAEFQKWVKVMEALKKEGYDLSKLFTDELIHNAK